MFNIQDTTQVMRAQSLLSAAVTALAHKEITDTGIRPLPTPDAPNTWEDLKAVDLSTGVLPVWNGASTHTVYGSAWANVLFRYWHDMGHLTFGYSFTPNDERALQYNHHLNMVAKRLHVDYSNVMRPNDVHKLAYCLYYADTVGQIDYIVANGQFPVDQRAFALAYVQDKDKAVATLF